MIGFCLLNLNILGVSKKEECMCPPKHMYKDDGAALLILVHYADNIMPSGLRVQEILWIP